MLYLGFAGVPNRKAMIQLIQVYRLQTGSGKTLLLFLKLQMDSWIPKLRYFKRSWLFQKVYHLGLMRQTLMIF